MHLFHSYTHLDLGQFCWVLVKSRDTVTWSSFGVDRAMEVSITNCNGHISGMYGGKYTEDGIKKSNRKPILFSNVDQSTTGTSICPPNLGTFAHFLTTRPSGVKKPDDSRIFSSQKPIIFHHLIIHLRYSCTHSVLDNSCTILHMSRCLHLAKGVRWRYRY